MKGYETIPKISQSADVTATTIRRYVKHYPQFFQSRQVNGYAVYPVEPTIKLIRRIGEVSGSGKRRGQVYAQLEEEFPMISDPETVQPAQPHAREKSSVPAELLYVLQEIRDELREIKGGLKAVSEGMAK